MTAPAVVLELQRRGIHLSLAGQDQIAFDGPPSMSPGDVDLIRAHKPAILAFLRESTKAHFRHQGDAEPDAPQAREAEREPDLDAFEERAAILEFDGGFSRDEAERRAARELGYVRPPCTKR
jgi:hypothetical protein